MRMGGESLGLWALCQWALCEPVTYLLRRRIPWASPRLQQVHTYSMHLYTQRTLLTSAWMHAHVCENACTRAHMHRVRATLCT